MATKQKWHKICNNYIEETENHFSVLHVDAWQTENECEEGRTIAKLIGINVEEKPRIYLSLHDVDVLSDPHAKKIVHESYNILRRHLKSKSGE